MLAIVILNFSRSTPVERVSSLSRDADALDVGTDRFASTFALFTGTPLAAGNALAILANGDETFPCLSEDLEQARSLVTWQVFWVRPGALADRALDVLGERARSGVRVLCLLDAFGSHGLGDAFPAPRRGAALAARSRHETRPGA